MSEERQQTQNMMIAAVPIPEAHPLFTDPEVLADAEEEEMTELWAADPGNQGA